MPKLKRASEKELKLMVPSVLDHYARKMKNFNSFDTKLMQRAEVNRELANKELKARGLPTVD